jgi:CheY-like chemotaxis protein
MMQVDRCRQLHRYIRQKEQEHRRKFVEYRSHYEQTGKTSDLLIQTEYQGAVTAYQDLLNVYEMQSMAEERSAHQYMPEQDSPQLPDGGSVVLPNISQGFQILREYCDRKHQEVDRQIRQCQQRFTATGNEKYMFLQRKYTGAVMAYDAVTQFLGTLNSADEECASPPHPRTETHHHDAMQPAPPLPQKPSHSFVHILALEASSMVRKMLEMLLISEGFTVTTASDGVVGLEIARKISPDLILMDNSIAWRNEEQLLFLLRRDKRLRRIPIILLTSSIKGFDERLKKHVGVMVSIQKPFQPEELLNAIQQVLAQ